MRCKRSSCRYLSQNRILWNWSGATSWFDRRVGNQVVQVQILMTVHLGYWIIIFARSLTIHRPADSAAKENLLLILQRLVEEGFLKNNRQFAIFDCSRSPRFVEVIFSMNNLQKLDLWDCELTLEQVAQLFQSCPKLIELHLKLSTCEMDEDLKDQLRPGIQRLQIFELEWYIDIKRWSVIKEMCT